LSYPGKVCLFDCRLMGAREVGRVYEDLDTDGKTIA